MATPILKVITEYCAIQVEDINLQTLAQEDPPLYARRMWGHLRAGIPLFTLPATMQTYLLGTETNPKLTEPKCDSYLYTVEIEAVENITIELGDEYIGYELFCCRLRTYDDFGNVILTNTDIASYDPEAGIVTLQASVEKPIPQGMEFDMDFYTDGAFANTLSPEMMSILGDCFAVIWQTNFNNNFLSNVSKVEDPSFKEQNRANKIRSDTERLQAMRTQLAEQMRRYEQNLVQHKTIPNWGAI